jgi:hypothetical protein
MPRPGATCSVRPNGTGGAGLPGRRTGDVRPAEMGGGSPPARWTAGACRSRLSFPEVISLHVLTYPYSRGSSSGVAHHFVGSLGATPLGRTCLSPHPWGWARRMHLTPHRWGRARRTHPIPYSWGRARWPCPSPVLRVGLSVPLLPVGHSAAI